MFSYTFPLQPPKAAACSGGILTPAGVKAPATNPHEPSLQLTRQRTGSLKLSSDLDMSAVEWVQAHTDAGTQTDRQTDS